MLGPGERIVVTNDRDAFLAFYFKAFGLRGCYDGKLDNAGERLTFGTAKITSFSVDYKDGGRWPERATDRQFTGSGQPARRSIATRALDGQPHHPWIARKQR